MSQCTTFQRELKALDFFCGVGGMSYGLYKAEVKLLGGIDLDSECKQTYEANLPGAKFLTADITTLEEQTLAREFGVTINDDNLVFAGCSPCQFWSKVRTERTKSEKTAFLLKHFERFIDHFRPGYVIIENVPGLLTKKEHSILPQFLTFLTTLGYAYSDGIIDASLYGVPQHRHRYLLIATRVFSKVNLPRGRANRKLTVHRFIGPNSGLTAVAAGETDKKDKLHRAAALTAINLARIEKTPSDGGERSSWKNDPELQLRTYVGRDNIFRHVYGRMFWQRPAPTITTRFNSISNGRFGHPQQHRAITLREGALLQTFPKSFRFHSANQASIARQIGNAVPPELARRIGLHLRNIANHG